MAIIQEISQKIKDQPRVFWENTFVAGVIVLVAGASFGLGRLSVLYGPESDFEVVYPEGQEAAAVESEGQYVASRSGSKYHFPWCPGAQAMNEENKIYFSSKEDAEAAGYGPAANCKGL